MVDSGRKSCFLVALDNFNVLSTTSPKGEFKGRKSGKPDVQGQDALVERLHFIHLYV